MDEVDEVDEDDRSRSTSPPTCCASCCPAPPPAHSHSAPQSVVAAGRPACPFCTLPLDPDGHICPRQNGFRRG